MKKIAVIISVILFTATGVFAQYAAQLSAAGTVLKGSAKGGAYVGVYDGAFGILGQYRYGIGGYTDLGIKLGVIDLKANSREGDTGFTVSADTKYQVMEVRIMDPIDMSVGGIFEFVKFNHYSNLVLGGTLVGSYPVALKSGRRLIPYGRLIMGLERGDPTWGSADTDFNIALNMGSTFELSASTEAVAELQIDSDVAAFLLGLTFGL